MAITQLIIEPHSKEPDFSVSWLQRVCLRPCG
jgi:hypothetical protein